MEVRGIAYCIQVLSLLFLKSKICTLYATEDTPSTIYLHYLKTHSHLYGVGWIQCLQPLCLVTNILVSSVWKNSTLHTNINTFSFMLICQIRLTSSTITQNVSTECTKNKVWNIFSPKEFTHCICPRLLWLTSSCTFNCTTTSIYLLYLPVRLCVLYGHTTLELLFTWLSKGLFTFYTILTSSFFIYFPDSNYAT